MILTNDALQIYMLSYAVMLGASSVFVSSFGYQTNLMSLAAGGHSSVDFIKVGGPMQVRALLVLSIVLSITQSITHDMGHAVRRYGGAPAGRCSCAALLRTATRRAVPCR